MKFEKINKDKIKVTINSDDLSQKDLDYNSFISDSDETQSLFLDVLDVAEKDFGFSTKDYNLKVETLALSDGDFVLTITRILDSESDSVSNHISSNIGKKPKATRKKPSICSSMIYKFNSFDDFCNFASYLDSNLQITNKKIAKDTSLYLFNGEYYLIFTNVNSKFPELKKAFSIITEFATYINSSNIFIAKICECGKPIFKTNAITKSLEYFK